MNLILFESAVTSLVLPAGDARAQHLRKVLRRKAGETFDAGVINGPRGKGTVARLEPDAIALSFAWGAAAAPLDPLMVLVGLPRPQTARDILREATALGVGALHFFRSEKGEASYAQSTLWSTDEWRRQLVAGAEQAFDTRLPEVSCGRSLADTLAALPRSGARIALDNYEASAALSACALDAPVTLAFGPERGWSAAERTALREAGFTLAHLGARVLRSETAVIAAVAVVKAKLGWL